MVPPKATRKRSEKDRKINKAFIFLFFNKDRKVCAKTLNCEIKKAPYSGAYKRFNKDLYNIGGYTVLFLSSNVSTKHAKRATDINASILF